MQTFPWIYPNVILAIILVLLFVGLISYGFYRWQRMQNAPADSRSKPLPSSASSHSSVASSSTTTPLTQPQASSRRPVKLNLGDEAHPWGEIIRYPRAETALHEEIQLNESATLGLSHWFQHAPSLAANSALMMSNTYKLTFNPEIAKGLANGSLQLSSSMEGGLRAIAVDGQKAFLGHGSLYPLTGLKLTAGAVAAWQVLATITAQKFLVDIDRQLAKLNKGIEELKDFLAYQQYAALVGNMKYLDSIWHTLHQQQLEMTEVGVFLNQLEEIDRESLQIMVALQLQMEKTQKEFVNQPLGAYFSAQEYLSTSEKLIERYEQQARNYLVAASVKGLAAQTRCALPASPALAIERLEALQTDLSTWDEKQQEFYWLIGQRSPELKDWFDSGYKKRRQLNRRMMTSRESLRQRGKEVQALVQKTTHAAQAQLAERMQPVSLIVELNENGQIAKSWQVREAHMPGTDHAV